MKSSIAFTGLCVAMILPAGTIARAERPAVQSLANNNDDREDRAAAKEWASKVHKGAILHVSGMTLSCEDMDGKRFSARGDDKTEVWFKGKKVEFKNLQPKLMVVITPGKEVGQIRKIEVVETVDALKQASDTPGDAKKK